MLLIMEKSNLIWLNGEFVNWEDANISVMSHTLHYGTGVFEGVRAYQAKNKSAIFIDHNIIHVYGAADRFIILDRGEVVGEFNKEEISREELVQKMIQLHESGKIKVED